MAKELSSFSLEPDADTIAEIETVLVQSIALLQSVFSITINRPTLTYNLTGRVAGRAWVKRNEIELNLDLLRNPLYHEDMINRTLPHELAHIVAGKVWPTCQSHGAEWKYVMRVLGLPPERCHEYDTKPARVHVRNYVYYCLCPDPHYVTNLLNKRIEQGRIYTCNTCKVQLRKEQY